MLTYRVDVSSILEDLGASEVVDGQLPLDRLLVGDTEFVLVAPASFTLNITNTGAGLVADGTVAARAAVECARCLERFETLVEGTVEGFYVHPGHDRDIPEDQETEPIAADSTIDIAPALMAALTLEAPFAPVHDEDCRGLCPVCGCDLNVHDCGCASTIDEAHPFAGLRGLLGEETPDR